MRANDSKSTGAGSVLLGIAAIALAGMAGTIGLIHEAGEFGPKVGDIVVFDPLDPISRDMHARLPAISADDRPGVACALDVQVMHAGGGSVIVEGREPGTEFGYRVHWAGARSSDDGADCGAFRRAARQSRGRRGHGHGGRWVWRSGQQADRRDAAIDRGAVRPVRRSLREG